MATTRVRRGTVKAKGKSDVDAVLASLRRLASKEVKDGMARYAIPSDRAFGVAVGAMRKLAKELGRDHALAGALWKAGWYEARMMAAFVGEPERVTPAEMDRWCKDFDSWAICDTVCFHLWDRTPHALKKAAEWCGRTAEFEKRAGLALVACVALHDRGRSDGELLRCLPLIGRAAVDERNFVKKGAVWALRGFGGRSAGMHQAAVELAQRLAASPAAAPRWVGKTALRELTSPAALRRLMR